MGTGKFVRWLLLRPIVALAEICLAIFGYALFVAVVVGSWDAIVGFWPGNWSKEVFALLPWGFASTEFEVSSASATAAVGGLLGWYILLALVLEFKEGVVLIDSIGDRVLGQIAIAPLGLLPVLFGAAAVVGFFVAVVVGAWDLIVWLTRADWRTTSFAVPKFAAMITVGAIALIWLCSAVLDHLVRTGRARRIPKPPDETGVGRE